jgi:hypothetical protein
MPGAGRAVRARLARFAASHPGLAARLRLFGLLLLLLPLFAGLQRLILEAAPPAEVQVVARDVPILVPVERVVERVVEHIVYVPVPVPADEPAEPAEPSSPSPTSPSAAPATPTVLDGTPSP